MPWLATTRVIGLNNLSPTARNLFCRHEVLHRVAEAYSRSEAPVAASIVERKRTAPGVELEPWHFDGLDKRFKAFVYLNDVDEKNGPFEYLIGSHRLSVWKFKRLFAWHRTRTKNPNSGDFFDKAHFRDDEATDVLQRFPRVTVTGKTGTLFLFDGRGIHRGRTLESGTRVIMYNGYRAKNF